MKRIYGWKKDKLDKRDKIYKNLRLDATKLPVSVDLRSKCSPIVNQTTLGSCTANAIAGALGFLHNDFIASRLFIYYNERAMEKNVNQDSGAAIRDGIKSVASLGVCRESDWPYDVNKFKIKPPAICYQKALKDVVTSYSQLQGLNDMKVCLASGFPFVFGFTVYSGFESASVAKTGILNLPTKNETVEGGHAVMAVGYDDKTSRIIVRNSWGTDWGMKGYFTIPYSYISNPNLADDMWTIRAENIGA